MRIRFILIAGAAGLYLIRPLNAAFEPLPVSARAAAMGQAVTALPFGMETMDVNPAALDGCKSPEISLFLSHPYGLKELACESLSAALPAFTGSLGVQLRTFGSKLYRENWAGLGFARSFGNFSAGVQCRILQLAIERYGSVWTGTFDAGVLYAITGEIRVGCAISNLPRTRLGRQNQPLPQTVRLGIAFLPVQSVTFAFEADKDTRYPATLRGGMELWPLSSLALRIGFSQHPGVLACGLGLKLLGWELDYGWNDHPVLGATHLISLVWQKERNASVR